ncbi:hypothetical protein BN1723_007068 [Verticillium longisporum]|uniref:Major facilitator superfamily (MFS) profile domain-containing protein n=1 Tax=Verticillium longisporum TaxID=100787 RepID=A0A0G4NJ44_VERLO|nr:hypothetical protein BN1723_007068 [Verticillium longisporum]
MAGGVKKPVNIFNLKNLGEPEGVFNWRLWFAVVSFGLLGAARGVDEGLISGAFKSKDFQRFIHYENYDHVEQTNIKANVSAMVQIGSVGGALIAFLICDKIGRIWATRQLCVVWAVGIIIFMCNNGHLGAVYAGRFIAGLGVGQTPVVGPVYLAEIAPASIRGLCTCMFTGFVYLGIVLAYFANYGCQLHLGDNTHNRWLVPTSLHIMFAGIIFILTFFQYESPRFLVKQGRVEEATSVMSHLRHLPEDHEYIRALLIGITLQAIAMVYVAGFLTGIPQLGVVDDFEVPKKDLGASRGAIAMIYISGFGWALGWNSMQYLLTAELFPLRIRALATSWAMTLHFSNQYGNSRAVPNMLLPTGHGGISPKGTFWCFAAVTIIGGIWVWFFVPETGGRSLESMDRLFDLPWYRIGLFGNKDAEEQDAIYDEKAEAAEHNIGQSEHAEKRDERKEIA